MKTIYKVLIVGGVIGAGFYLMDKYKKVKTLQEQFDKLLILPTNIKNFKVGLQQLSFDLDLKIINNSPEDIQISGDLITLESIIVYYNGNYIATATKNIGAIQVLSNRAMELKDVHFEIPTMELISNFPDLTNFSLDSLTIQANLNVLGQKYQIKNK